MILRASCVVIHLVVTNTKYNYDSENKMELLRQTAELHYASQSGDRTTFVNHPYAHPLGIVVLQFHVRADA
jgi:hypothetical protein